ncbi:glycerol uptake operon antiterminator [Marininema mesophilum]|uniref:Glycerol uptake operon antiterminator regulatory protein n=1 Tax=Marininema mesophilum TaxID=1048340 RepID=A0A1H2Q6C8_9BACL|nr:glycerol-3-phosphate responsive antiterminator [Marininema mesophilum]SDW02560.1 glycerol uptake operon antiterminator [Marininema mesophilum]
MGDFKQAIQRHPVIAAVRSEEDLNALKDSKPTVCFLLAGEINTLKQTVDCVRNMGKLVYIHLDLAQGLGNDRAALQYLKKVIHPDGILSTRTNLVRFAREEGLFAIQRLFIPDGMSVETGINLLKQSKADATEIMPGVIPSWVFKDLRKKSDIPIVAGGLLRERYDVENAFKNGASAVSVSRHELWSYDGYPIKK